MSYFLGGELVVCIILLLMLLFCDSNKYFIAGVFIGAFAIFAAVWLKNLREVNYV